MASAAGRGGEPNLEFHGHEVGEDEAGAVDEPDFGRPEESLEVLGLEPAFSGQGQSTPGRG
jgi:hypothetical protein